MNQSKLAISSAFLAFAGLGCGDDAPPRKGTLPWDDGHTYVVGADRDVTEVATPEGQGCLQVGQEFADPANCVKPQDACEGRASDVLLDAEGKLLDTLCYPESETLSVADLLAHDGAVAQSQNNAVIVLDPDPDVDFKGDLSVDANNVIVYGDSPDNAVIDGDLAIDGNNAVVRGVRIKGDVVVSKNDATLFFCVIEGNLTVSGNNAVIAGCDVLGTLTVAGNNSRLVGNHVVNLALQGKNPDCDGNLQAEDVNHDGVLASSEFGTPLSCD